jgi:signal transduction histidine kinase
VCAGVDDGPGIPADERETVFDSGYSTADSGVGLGLAIVKEIVQAHGWTVEITRSEHGGTRFEISDVDRLN